MLTWFGVAVAFIAALALTPVAIRLAKKYHIVDIPNARKVHTQAMPRMGGIAIYFSSWRLYATGSCAAECRQYCNAYWSGRRY